MIACLYVRKKKLKKMFVERNIFRLLGYAIKFAPVLFIFKTIWVVIKTLKTIMVECAVIKNFN